MTDIWIVLVEDRHADVDALPFSSEARAAEVARAEVSKNAWHPEDIDWEAEITPRAAADGVVFLAIYGTEGDCVSVVRRTLDGEQ